MWGVRFMIKKKLLLDFCKRDYSVNDNENTKCPRSKIDAFQFGDAKKKVFSKEPSWMGGYFGTLYIPLHMSKTCRKKTTNAYMGKSQKHDWSKMSKIDGNYGNFFTRTFAMSSDIWTARQRLKKRHIGSIVLFFFAYCTIL